MTPFNTLTIAQLRKIQKSYWNFVMGFLPRIHLILIGFTLMTTYLSSFIIIILGAGFEINRGNNDFILDWLNYGLALYYANLQPIFSYIAFLWNLNKYFSIVMLISLIGGALTSSFFGYRFLFPNVKAYFLYEGTLCPHFKRRRLLWVSDSDYWINRVFSMPDKLLWALCKTRYRNPSHFTNFKRQDDDPLELKDNPIREYSLFKGLWGFFKLVIYGFKGECLLTASSQKFTKQDPFLYHIETLETTVCPDGRVMDSSELIVGYSLPLPERESVIRSMMDDSLDTMRMAAKHSPATALWKEQNGIVYEKSPHEKHRDFQESLSNDILDEVIFLIFEREEVLNHATIEE